MSDEVVDKVLLEKLATLEHEQWMYWAESLMEIEDLSPGRIERWESYIVPYEELSEEVKEHDRKWARRVLNIIKRHLIGELYRVDDD